MGAMSRYSQYPYQSTTVNTNNTIHQHQQQPLRNPWTQPCESRSTTNSSSSSRTYRNLPWQQQQQQQHYTLQSRQQHTVEVMVDGPAPGYHGNTLHLHPPPSLVRYSSSSDHERPVTPASSPGGRTAVDGCGGHCVAFETFCYYCLQVIFIAGILTGVSLTIAGSVLRSQQRGGDLLVLVYIGCMISMVCALLLSVQCCVRRNVKHRKRTMRSQRDRVGQRRAASQAANVTEIPMQDMKNLTLGRNGPPQQYQPLLMHIVQQQQQQQQYHPPATNYRSDNTGFVGRIMDVSKSGTPWWRRQSDHGPSVEETRH